MPVGPRGPDRVRGRREPRTAGGVAQPVVWGAKGGELSAAVLGADSRGAAGSAPGQLTCAAGNGRGEQVSNLRRGAGAAGHRGEPAARRASPRGMKRSFQEMDEPRTSPDWKGI